VAALPEVLRYVAGPLQTMTDGRLDASILPPVADCIGHDQRDAAAPPWSVAFA